MFASEEVAQFLNGCPKIPSADECKKTLLTTDGKGKEAKAVALYYLLASARDGSFGSLSDKSTIRELRVKIRSLELQFARETKELKESNGHLKEKMKEHIKVCMCFYCDQLIQNPTRDHFIAESKGGGRGMNLVGSCAKCNTRKGHRNPSPAEIKRFIALCDEHGIELRKYL